MLEKHIERRCCARVLDELGVVSVKLVTPGATGYPDRMFLIPGGSILMIEFKAPGESPRPKQLHIHARLKQLGFRVEVHDDEEAAFESVKRLLDSGLGIG